MQVSGSKIGNKRLLDAAGRVCNRGSPQQHRTRGPGAGQPQLQTTLHRARALLIGPTRQLRPLPRLDCTGGWRPRAATAAATLSECVESAPGEGATSSSDRGPGTAPAIERGCWAQPCKRRACQCKTGPTRAREPCELHWRQAASRLPGPRRTRRPTAAGTPGAPTRSDGGRAAAAGAAGAVPWRARCQGCRQQVAGVVPEQPRGVAGHKRHPAQRRRGHGGPLLLRPDPAHQGR